MTPKLEMIKAFAAMRHDSALLEIAARAYDREDSAQRGEPDPWGLSSDDADMDRQWREERMACALCALEALALHWQHQAMDEELVSS
jgi:hypothetical protein